MRLNASTALVGPRVVLVPYCSQHVPTYHAWMENEDIRQATASERLTLDEEYAMQLSWREDADKLTFIACRRDGDKSMRGPVDAGVDDAPDLMIGDVNLFLSEIEDEEDDNGTANTNGLQPSVHRQKGPKDLVGEVELMIAIPEQQGKGYGRAVLQLFLRWVLDHRDEVVREKLALLEEPGELKKLRVKIHESNYRSLGLFESLGFRRTQDESNYFGEVEMDIGLQNIADGHWEAGDWTETEYRQPLLHGDGVW